MRETLQLLHIKSTILKKKYDLTRQRYKDVYFPSIISGKSSKSVKLTNKQ